MNKANLKSYAPQARKDFIAAVTARANQLGLSNKAGTLEVAPAQTQGDVTVIAGQAWPSKVNGQRNKLINSIRKDGFENTMEAVAYTWFNRFAALRYMELHNYLDHGYRALSSTAGGLPDILTHATDLANDLPGLSATKVTELKLAGNRDDELYRMLLVAQCNALSRAMPFLFERIDDDSELLLPDNLRRSDSIISKLVAEIPEEDWAEVEIIGWLYQFYISEKKDQVIGKVIKSEDIPAATQLFTPNWIVRYLVQNSVGRLWLMANPQSTLAKEWPYYITPAEQTPEVQAHLNALIQTRVREDGDTLNPESITVLDPACGSGHILVVAYDVLKAIYLERGYQPRAIPRLILEKNLFGIDIDNRAAQMAGFALLMKARADDNRLFRETISINIFKLEDSLGIDRNEIFENLKTYGLKKNHIFALLDCFLNASTLGSLIRVSKEVESYLKEIKEGTQRALKSGDLYVMLGAEILSKFVEQAEIISKKFDSLVANPPYMGGKGMNAVLKEYAKENFKSSKSDLYSMFIERGFEWCKLTGFNAQLTMHSWMFLSSFQQMRTSLLNDRTIINMAHLGGRAFAEITGDVVKTVAFVFHATQLKKYKPTFFKLTLGNSIEKCEQLIKGRNKYELTNQEDFKTIPGETIAYWISKQILNSFSGKKIFDFSISDGQCKTADNDKYVRCWWEVNIENFGIGKKWLTYCKGGPFKKWYGNAEYVIDWSDEARSHYRSSERCRIVPEYLWYKEGITWSRVASKDTPNAFRVLPKNSTFDMVGSSIFIEDKDNLTAILCLLNSKFFSVYIEILNPTIDIQVRDVRNIPFDPKKIQFGNLVKNGERLIEIAKEDWDQNEVSYEFQKPACISYARTNLLCESWENWSAVATNRRDETMKLEKSNNKILEGYFGLKNEEDFTIAIDQISLATPDKRVDCQNFVSYAIGCKFGRYDLNSKGISYAGERGVNFDANKYKLIDVDPDGFVPAMESEWFENDAANSVLEVIGAIFTKQTREENLSWIAESFGRKANESSIETLRRYFCSEFYKNHLKKYINRPIYWNLSSGRLGAFNGFLYLHRYNDGTIPRIRSKYIVPLLTKIKNRIDMLKADVVVVGTTSGRSKIEKQLDLLNKKFGELTIYDERIRHFIDMKIQVNLDDGVRVNYAKFGKLLAEGNVVTGNDNDS